MRFLFAVSIVIVAAALGTGLAAAGEAKSPADRAAADVSLIAAWIAGSVDAKGFKEPFGDASFITKSDDALLYTDVEGVAVPPKLRRVPYDFIKSRMDKVRNGHKVAPAVLITKSIAEDPEEGVLESGTVRIGKPIDGERYYYVEVAIGNMAWHWMKIRVYEADGAAKAEVIQAAMS